MAATMNPGDDRGHFGAVFRSLWRRPDFSALAFRAKAVYIYAKTCPEGNMVGIFRLRAQDIDDDLGLGVRVAEHALRELALAGFIQRERSWIWIVDALATVPGITANSLQTNPKHRVGAQKALEQVPTNLADECRKLYGLYEEGSIALPIANGEAYGIHGKRETVDGIRDTQTGGRETGNSAPPAPSSLIEELEDKADKIAEEFGVPVSSVIRDASLIEASNGQRERSFEDPWAKGISAGWLKATLNTLPVVREALAARRRI